MEASEADRTPPADSAEQKLEGSREEAEDPSAGAARPTTGSKRKRGPEGEVESKPKRQPSETKSTERPTASKCRACKQRLDDVALYSGDAEDALEEMALLSDERLSLYTGDEEGIGVDEVPQNKMTDFSIYDKYLHLCHLDVGLIEKNVELFISGVVKPIYDDNPCPEGGVPAKAIGPINCWWIAGFDGGERGLLGITTAYAEYYLMNPSDQYSTIMENLVAKMYLSKIVIEYLTDHLDASYEDLLNIIQTTSPPESLSCASFNEEMLQANALFLVDQVESYDAVADPDENFLLSTPCMKHLVRLSSAKLSKRRIKKRSDEHIPRKRPKQSKATTTPMVSSVFDVFFKGQIDEKASEATLRRHRCGVCEACQQPDCGKCAACRDKIKFGGTSKAKRACSRRRCPFMTVSGTMEGQGEEEEEEEEEEEKKRASAKVARTPAKKEVKAGGKKKSAVSWGEPLATLRGIAYYRSATVGTQEIFIRDYVTIPSGSKNPRTPLYVAQIRYMWQDRRGQKRFHCNWLNRGTETILGRTSDSCELFVSDECTDNLLSCIVSKVDVTYRKPPENWSMLGGEDVEQMNVDEEDGSIFFYQKWYDPKTARFEDVPEEYLRCEEIDVTKEPKCCPGCDRRTRAKEYETPRVEEQVGVDEKRHLYKCLHLFGETFRADDCAYLLPKAFKFRAKPAISKRAVHTRPDDYDEDLYPEMYRKTSSYVKGSASEVPDPFRIGRIKEIFTKVGKQEKREEEEEEEEEDEEEESDSDDDGDDEKAKTNIFVRVTKFYRREDTHRGVEASYNADWNHLHASSEEVTVSASLIQGKCSVAYRDPKMLGDVDWKPDSFYFVDSYDETAKSFGPPPQQALSRKKGKGKALLGTAGAEPVAPPPPPPPPPDSPFRPLRSLDLFAGCGGLSLGFRQSGLADSLWAVELDEPAVQSFRRNHAGATVFQEDCNDFLRMVMDGKETNERGQTLPQKGDVELLCGGPPCQGFSGMNRFNFGSYSRFKNSLVVSLLSCCDYYRPRFFVLENVRNIVCFKRGMVLKLTLCCLLRMGYQCTVAVLQAGSYGVAQTRRRAILLAAAPGEKLPSFPEPTHVFSPKACQLSIQIDERRYDSNIRWVSSRPYRTITVRDTMWDLPRIQNGASKREISYRGEAESHFQRKIRGDSTVLLDHVCKEMSLLVEARMRRIPTHPGADWRDLPNEEIRLSDGTAIKKLEYRHDDVKNGASGTGAFRGICTCASGKPCEAASEKQSNTLIPWCLPHTANRHNHWAGLYGRLEWDGYFSTTITNPEPMGKQGRVLHPNQNRVVSVRECARSQGFPDSYHFYGNILDQHRQVGNAVPPPLAAAIGCEIKRAAETKEQADV